LSPDGERVAFGSYSGVGVDIYVLQAGNPEPVRLIQGADDPAWSPDGARIAFVSERDGNPEIYVMNSDGSAVTRLTNHPAPDRAPAWSPDGTRVAFQSERDGNAEIYVMNADGTGVTRITNHPAADGWPTWSPDGTRIAFASERDGNWEIYVASADGSALTRLTRTPDHDETDPAWGPAAPAAAARAPLTLATLPAPAPGVVLLPPRYDPAQPIPVVIILPATYEGAARLLEHVGMRSVSEASLQREFEALVNRLLPGGGASGRGFAAILVSGSGHPTDYITGEAWSRTIQRYEQQALADLATFASRHRLDTTRVVLAGWSMGGDLAWALALRNPSRFRGAIVMGSRASYRPRPADHRALAERGMRFFFAIGEAEENVRLVGARAAARFLEQLGVEHRYREIPGAWHSPAPPEMFAEALAFLLQPMGATTEPSVPAETIARWAETGGPPGFINCLAVSGTNLFAGTGGEGVFVSTNNGPSWTAVNAGLPRRFPVRALAVSGTNLFAGTDDGVFLSTNGGASWSSAGLWRDNVNALAVSGTSIFAGTRGGVFFSTNNGARWTEVNTGLPRRPSVFALAVSGTNLFAGTVDGVFLSTNNGASWTAVNTGLPAPLYVLALAVSGTSIFAAGESGVFRSTNNGASWSAAGLEEDVVRALVVSGTHVFAGTRGGGVLLSTNNGASWTVAGIGLEDGDVSALAVSGTHLFAGTNRRGVWRLPLSAISPLR
jgi:pimeloyl-ACP methyl ester carboxylesterase